MSRIFSWIVATLGITNGAFSPPQTTHLNDSPQLLWSTESSHDTKTTLTASATKNILGSKTIGVDHGTVRTGVAVTIGYAPVPLRILRTTNQPKIRREWGDDDDEEEELIDYGVATLTDEILRVAEAERAERIVVGLPLHKNGTVSEQSEIASHFARNLSAACYGRFGPSFEVLMFDERYTSKAAEARSRSVGLGQTTLRTTSRQLSGTLDAEAACILLEHFYARNGKGGIRVIPPADSLDACMKAWETRKEQMKAAAAAEATRRSLKAATTKTPKEAKREVIERVRLLTEQWEQKGILRKQDDSKKKKKKKKKK